FLHDLVVGIAEQRERQLVLRAELLVGLAVIRRNAEHHGAELLDLAPVIAKAAGLLATPRSVILRIEVQNHLAPAQIRERTLLALPVLEREGGCLLAFLDRHDPSPRAAARAARF